MAPFTPDEPSWKPVVVNWNLSYRCNFYCHHCYSRTEAHCYPEPDTDTALATVERFAEIGVLSINIGGGEPFTRRDLFTITSRAAQRGLRVTLSSNGSLITAAVARKAAEAGIRKVELSLDSVYPEVHDRFRNFPGSFRRVLEAARHLREAGVTVNISSVICRINIADWEGLVDLAAALGATKISLQNYKCAGLGDLNRERLDLSPTEWRDFYRRAVAVRRRRRDLEVSLSDPILHALEGAGGVADPAGENRPLTRGCACGTLTMCVRPDGGITPCAFIPVTVGNILEDDFPRLWATSPTLLQLRHRGPRGKCRSCPVWERCRGGCPSRSYAVSRGFDTPDPHCWRPVEPLPDGPGAKDERAVPLRPVL